jgi:hypothetical protein
VTRLLNPLQQSPYSLLACVAAIALFVIGLRWGTFAAGGSDSSCYLNQARLFRSGTTHIDQPLIAEAPWPHAEWTFVPAGHIPSAVGRDRSGTRIVPMCPPGLPLVMTGFSIVRGGEFLVVPLAGALAVWLTFVLGRRLESERVGAAAAILVACSPIVLFQVVQPMTDVPAMTWWLLAAVLAIGPREGESRPFAAGLAASMAILTRPNLFPLAMTILLYLGAGFSRPKGQYGESGFSRTGDGPPKGGLPVLSFLAGLVPGLALLAILQAKMYGSPLASGYGPAPALFTTANILPNLARYPRWLLAVHTPFLVLAFAAPFLTRRRAEVWLGLAIVATTLAMYLPYIAFEDWWFVRFLLPAIPWLVVLSAIVVDRIATRMLPRRAAFLTLAIAAILGAAWIGIARDRRAFELVQLERHFIDAGAFAAEHLPANAAVLTIRHSGSVYYYSHHPTVSWDTLPPDALDRALAFLRQRGLTPFLLLDTAEEPLFRQRFEATSPIGRLDWPPIARVGRTIRVYDPADRDRYFSRARNLSLGQPVQPRIWETSATRFVRFASSPSSRRSPS